MQERKRNLDSEKKIRDKERDVETIKREISVLEEQIGGFSIETLTEERLKLTDEGIKLQTRVGFVMFVILIKNLLTKLLKQNKDYHVDIEE